MPQSWIGHDGEDIGRHVEEDVEGGEDQAAGLHHRHVTLGNVINQILPHAGIDEDHLDHDDADDEEGEVDDFRVEHFYPKNATQEHGHNYHLDWRNLLGVCHGGSQPYVPDPEWRYSSQKRDRSCDVPKGGREITNYILNPLKIPGKIRLFRYAEHSGRMYVDEDTCPKDLQGKARSTIRELNLNAPRLMLIMWVAG